jgi:hypothetical protein
MAVVWGGDKVAVDLNDGAFRQGVNLEKIAYAKADGFEGERLPHPDSRIGDFVMEIVEDNGW